MTSHVAEEEGGDIEGTLPAYKEVIRTSHLLTAMIITAKVELREVVTRTGRHVALDHRDDPGLHNVATGIEWYPFYP